MSETHTLTTKAEQRFWSRVIKTDGCWLWADRRSPRGYGLFRLPVSDQRARAMRGARHSQAKLTEKQVRHIRLYHHGLTQEQIARKFGVAQITISNIRRRKTWAWL